MRSTYNSLYWILCCLLDLIPFGFASTANETDANTDSKISCEALLADSSFDLSLIEDTEWKEIGYWNVVMPGGKMSSIKFIKPLEAFIKRMLKSNGTQLENVDWGRVVLVTRTDDGLGGLFLKTDTPGLFNISVLPSYRYVASNKPISIGMKYLKEGFLMFMNCENLVGVVLGPVNTQPDLLDVQQKLNLKGFKVFFSEEANRVRRQAPTPEVVSDGLSIAEHDNVTDLDSLLNDMKSVYNENDSLF